jgi:hypothetical protein
MITGAIKSQIDQIWNAFWSGGISNPLEVIEQITYLLQREVAEQLDCADALRAKRRASIVQLDALAQSTCLDMFGDPVANQIGWPTARLGELLTFQQYGPRFFNEADSSKRSAVREIWGDGRQSRTSPRR